LNADVNALERLQMGSRFEVLVLWLEVQVMHGPGEVLRSLKFALDKRFVNDHLRRDVAELASLPDFHLLSHGLEVALHTVDAD
jgi:hypothetical protein